MLDLAHVLADPVRFDARAADTEAMKGAEPHTGFQAESRRNPHRIFNR